MTPQRDRWYRLSLVLMSVGTACIIAFVVLLVLVLSGAFKGREGPGPARILGDLAYWTTPQATPTAPLPTPDLAPIANLVIPRFEIDAPVVVRGVDANNVMETPDGPTDVAWYKFTSPPGAGSNAVFAGHVDYINYGAAVFWHLKDLGAGDVVEVHLEDGTIYKYQVVNVQSVPAEPTQEVLASIVGQTDTDVVTLITCGGAWDGREYDQRVIVRATRVLDTSAASAAAPAQ